MMWEGLSGSTVQYRPSDLTMRLTLLHLVLAGYSHGNGRVGAKGAKETGRVLASSLILVSYFWLFKDTCPLSQVLT